MKSTDGKRRIVLQFLLGALLGYGFLHPYTMVVYGLYGHPAGREAAPAPRHALHEILSAFDPAMIPMGLPFALLGGLVGLLSGLWLESRARRHEAEKRLLAVETLRQLMVTLSHHLLNAVQAIGGFAALLLRRERDEDARRRLELIRDEAVKIEAVVAALQSLESVSTERYTPNSETVMIDIRRELQEKLEALDRKTTRPAG